MAPVISQRNPDGKLQALRLDENDPEISPLVSDIIVKAGTTWLKNEEVLSILQFFVDTRADATLAFPDVAASRPEGGSLYIFSRKRCRSFRADKHAWRKKNDNKTIKETHEKLKVADKETLNCYYAHAESGDGLQRRCYWILDKQVDDVVMVHYLCAKTSRVVTGGREQGAAQDDLPRARHRPQRAASMKATFATLYSSDSEEIDKMNTNRASQRHHQNERQGVEEPSRPRSNANLNRFDDIDDLGDPLDSFMAKLPDDLGTFASRDLLLDALPDDLSITHEQLSRMLQATSPGKAQDVSLGISGLISGTSIGKEDLMELINEGILMTSPRGERRKGQASRQVSDADSLLKGFSRLESLEFLKMAGPDFPNLASGPSDDKVVVGDAGKHKDDDRVSTLRRVVAPASTSGMSHFQSMANASLSQSQDDTSGSHDVGNPRKTLVNPTATKEHGKSKADIAKDKADFNLQRRESLLRKVRNRNEGALIGDRDAENHESGDLIEPSNVLFRSSSHLMEKSDASPEKARALLKTMSIDDRDDLLLPTVLSAEMKSVGLGDAFGSTLAEEGAGDDTTTE